jgi:hypothetical protein
VDYLYAVTCFEIGLRPVGAANDLAVQFYGQSFGRERKLCDELRKRDGVRHVPRFAIDFNLQNFSDPFLETSGLMDNAA